MILDAGERIGIVISYNDYLSSSNQYVLKYFFMKIALAQINTQIGYLEGNVKKIIEFIQKAEKKGADLVVFPELSITGYPPKDLLEKPHFVEANLKALHTVAKKVRKTAAIVGFAEPNLENTGKSVFNSAALLAEGRVAKIQRKTLLPTYDVFDETRHFESGEGPVVLKYRGARLGLSICEDIWSEELFWGRKIYEADPIQQLSQQGMDFIINISASPYAMGKQKFRDQLLSKTAQRYRLPLVYVNLIGGNDDLIFDGTSTVVNSEGKICLKLKSFSEDLQVVDTKKLRSLHFSKENELGQVHQALVLGIRDYMKKTGFKKVVVGLSGGIDSSLVALLAAEACGEKNVLGVSLPSPFSSKGSLRDAQSLVKKLGIRYRIHPIGKVYEEYQNALGWRSKKVHVDVALQNIQARIRGNLIMALSNREGYLPLSTGNKSEMAVGYCTLYGDMAGGLAVISDLPKTLVYRLAKHSNQTKKVIPPAVFQKPPSPELAPNQKTQDDLPPFPILDEILRRYVEENEGLEEIVKAGFPKKLVRQVMAQVDKNEYKRKQAPPGIRVTSKAFGSGRRIPITNVFKE
jgi:NAD+ synthase (glutamine-hydrolysing)